MKRIASLDYLRGLMAFCVMLYHFMSPGGSPLGAGSTLARVGLYAVAVFYILSGISLTLAYQHTLTGWERVLAYAIKRVGRILPLFWLATSLVLVRAWLMVHVLHQPGAFPGREDIVLNYSLLFGWVKPQAYLVTGGWSIGNELVFYLIFPVVIALYRAWPGLCRVFFVILLMALCGYSALHLDASASLQAQWVRYILPANQFYLFFSGVLMALFFAPATLALTGWRAGLLLMLLMAFVYYPIQGDRVLLVLGSGRLVLSALSVLICFFVYRVSVRVWSWLHAPLSFLGETSYSIYLLHPIVASACWLPLSHCHVSRVWANFAVAMPLTLLLAYWSYRFVERPGLRFASKLAKCRSELAIRA